MTLALAVLPLPVVAPAPARRSTRRAAGADAMRCNNGRFVHEDRRELSVLIAQVGRGDHAAFGALYDELAPRVYGVVKRVVRDPAMSEEVTQEVFTEIWTTATRFDETRASVAGWVTMIARRRSIDRVRSEQSRRNRDDAAGGEASSAEAAAESVTESIVADRDEAVRVHAAMAALPADQRDVIRLAFLDGMTHVDIAESLGIPLGTVKGRVRLALKRLRVGLGDER